MMTSLKTAIGALLMLALTQTAIAETMVGTVISAIGPNSVERTGPSIELAEGALVFKEDIIYTGDGAWLEIEWFDSSETAMGANSMIFVSEYLQDVSRKVTSQYQISGTGVTAATPSR